MGTSLRSMDGFKIFVESAGNHVYLSTGLWNRLWMDFVRRFLDGHESWMVQYVKQK